MVDKNKNIYRQYFDQIRPDDKLVEATKQMMQNELRPEVSPDRHKIFKVNRYLALTACAAIAAASVLIVPKLSDDVPVSEVPSTTVLSDTSDINGDTSAVQSDSTSATDKNNSHAYTGSSASEKTEAAVNTKNSAASAGTSAQKHQQQPTVTDRPAQNNNQPAATDIPVQSNNTASQTQPGTVSTHQTLPATEEPPASTKQPAETMNTTTSYGKPHATSKPDQSDILITTSPADNAATSQTSTDMAIDGVNYSNSYIRNVAGTPLSVSYDDCREHFGYDVIPQCLRDLAPEASGTVEQGFYEYKTGAVFTYGTQGPLNSKNSVFISITVSDAAYVSENGSDELLGYKFFCYQPEMTQVGDKSCLIGRYYSDRGSDVYFCEFENKGVYYTMCFCNYSLERMIDVINNI
ncbi:MAG: hypothetical protein Q4F95_01035 [Oscillospiraceae bacterium]|nr:hypothetical protein [Oscillospiraceae bacterium]